MFELTILGNNAATPAFNRHPTAQVLSLPYTHFLIDCGEGTQMQMQKYKIKANKIQHILISHLHGDHYLGLLGLLSTMHLQKREKSLNLFGPKGLKEIITTQLYYSNTRFNYSINFFEIPPKPAETIYEDAQLCIETILMNHRIDCTGFLFREKKKKRKVLKDRLPEDMDWDIFIKLKNGEDIKDDKGEILYDVKTYTKESRSYSFAHCSDTLYIESLAEQLHDIDLLYHESTFLHADLDKAEQTCHSTAKQAATMAKIAEAKKLVIGHFSSRYKDLTPILQEAREVFPNTFLGMEGHKYYIDA